MTQQARRLVALVAFSRYADLAAGFRVPPVKNQKKRVLRVTRRVRVRCSRSRQFVERPIYRVICSGPPQLLVVMNCANDGSPGPHELKIAAAGEVIEQRRQETGKLAGVFPVELDRGARGKRGKLGGVDATTC